MKNKKLQKLMVGVLLCLIVVTVFFAIKASAQGQVLINLEDKAQNLKEGNQELNSEIVNSSSLSQIGKQAQAQGMVKPTKYVYMGSSGVAMR